MSNLKELVIFQISSQAFLALVHENKVKGFVSAAIHLIFTSHLFVKLLGNTLDNLHKCGIIMQDNFSNNAQVND